MWKIRDARPSDAEPISALHRADIERWTRIAPDGEETEVSYASLSPIERWRHGGPHMGVETLLPHLEQLLGSGQSARVALGARQEIVGELEVFTGVEADWGRAAHVSALYVSPGAQRQGVGTALLHDTIDRAQTNGCAWVTTRPEEDAVEFYRRAGLGTVLSRQRDLKFDLRDPRYSGGPTVGRSPLDRGSYRELEERVMLLGRAQTSFHYWQLRQWRIPEVTDRLAVEEGMVRDLDACYWFDRSLFAPAKAPEAYARAWVRNRKDLPAVLGALLSRLVELGFAVARTSVDESDLPGLRSLRPVEEGGFLLIGKSLGRGPSSPRPGDRFDPSST